MELANNEIKNYVFWNYKAGITNIILEKNYAFSLKKLIQAFNVLYTAIYLSHSRTTRINEKASKA